MRIKSMDEWNDSPKEFKSRYEPYIREEFRRRSEGLWFYNNGVPTYLTGGHYMLLQWGKIDGSFYGDYLKFQAQIHYHWEACKADPRCAGQNYVKCRRSGYTNVGGNELTDEGSMVRDAVLGIMSKTGKDAQENVFIKNVV